MKVKTMLKKFFTWTAVTSLVFSMTTHANRGLVRAAEVGKFVDYEKYSNYIAKDGDPEGVFENDVVKLTKKILSYDAEEKTFKVQLITEGKQKSAAGETPQLHVALILNTATYSGETAGADAASEGVEAGILTSKRVAKEVGKQLADYNVEGGKLKVTVITAGSDSKNLGTWDLSSENYSEFEAAIDSLEGEKGQFTAAAVKEAKTVLATTNAENKYLLMVTNGTPTYAYSGEYEFTLGKKLVKENPEQPRYENLGEEVQKVISLPIVDGAFQLTDAILGMIYEKESDTTFAYKKVAMKNVAEAAKKVFPGHARKQLNNLFLPVTAIAVSMASAIYEAASLPSGTEVHFAGVTDSQYLMSVEKKYLEKFYEKLQATAFNKTGLDHKMATIFHSVENAKIEDQLSENFDLVGDVLIDEETTLSKDSLQITKENNLIAVSADKLSLGKEDRLSLTYHVKLKDNAKDGNFHELSTSSKLVDGSAEYSFFPVRAKEEATLPPAGDNNSNGNDNQDTPPAGDNNSNGNDNQDTPPAGGNNSNGNDNQDTPPAGDNNSNGNDNQSTPPAGDNNSNDNGNQGTLPPAGGDTGTNNDTNPPTGGDTTNPPAGGDTTNPPAGGNTDNNVSSGEGSSTTEANNGLPSYLYYYYLYDEALASTPADPVTPTENTEVSTPEAPIAADNEAITVEEDSTPLSSANIEGEDRKDDSSTNGVTHSYHEVVVNRKNLEVAKVPTKDMKAVFDSFASKLTIHLKKASIELSTSSLTSLLENPKEKFEVKLTEKAVSKTAEQKKIKAKVKNHTLLTKKVYNLSIKVNNKLIKKHNFGKNPISISLKANLGKAPMTVFVMNLTTKKLVKATYDAKKKLVTFRSAQTGKFVLVKKEK